jgi:hypothetical protein
MFSTTTSGLFICFPSLFFIGAALYLGREPVLHQSPSSLHTRTQRPRNHNRCTGSFSDHHARESPQPIRSIGYPLEPFRAPYHLSLFQDFETHTVAKQTRARCPSHRIVAVQRAPGVLTSIGTGKATRIFAIHTEKISGRLSPSLTASLTMKHYNPPLDIRLTPALQPSLWLFRERWTFCAKGNAPCVDPTSPIFIFLCRLEYETHSYSNLQKNSKIHGHDGRCGSCGRDATCCLQHMWDM